MTLRESPDEGNNLTPASRGHWRHLLGALVVLAVVAIATLWITGAPEAVGIVLAPLLLVIGIRSP